MLYLNINIREFNQKGIEVVLQVQPAPLLQQKIIISEGITLVLQVPPFHNSSCLRCWMYYQSQNILVV